MPQSIYDAVSVAGDWLTRVQRWRSGVHERVRRPAGCGAAALLAAAIGVVCIGLVAVVWQAAHERPPTQVVTAPEAPWRYLAVCGACQQRQRLAEYPGPDWRQERGVFACSACGAFQVTVYRRGTQAVPPGGW